MQDVGRKQGVGQSRKGNGRLMNEIINHVISRYTPRLKVRDFPPVAVESNLLDGCWPSNRCMSSCVMLKAIHTLYFITPFAANHAFERLLSTDDIFKHWVSMFHAACPSESTSANICYCPRYCG